MKLTFIKDDKTILEVASKITENYSLFQLLTLSELSEIEHLKVSKVIITKEVYSGNVTGFLNDLKGYSGLESDSEAKIYLL